MDTQNGHFMRDVVEWDVDTWKKAIEYWNAVVTEEFEGRDFSRLQVLDIGARDGGTTLFFAEKGMRCVCSELEGPTDAARALHRRYGVETLVRYEKQNALDIGYPDDSFDIVCFKSVLGGIGMVSGRDAMREALDEMRRVLRPGGALLFAENAAGSGLHMFFRRHFVSWGKQWTYPSLQSMEGMLTAFSSHDVKTYGFFGCFAKNSRFVHNIDRLVCRKERSKNHYILFGSAKK